MFIMKKSEYNLFFYTKFYTLYISIIQYVNDLLTKITLQQQQHIYIYIIVCKLKLLTIKYIIKRS